MAVKSCANAERLVFHKLHEVGSGTVYAFLNHLLVNKDNFQMHDAEHQYLYNLSKSDPPPAYNHRDSDAEVKKWVKSGHVPKNTCAFALMRDPSERFLSALFKFPDVEGHVWHPVGYFEHATTAAEWAKISDKEKSAWVKKFNTDHIEGQLLQFHKHPKCAEPTRKCHPQLLDMICEEDAKFSEYSSKLKDAQTAEKLLSQFNVVGITDYEDDFLDGVCMALGLSDETCKQAKHASRNDDETNAHIYPPHPKVKDFSTKMQRNLTEALAAEWDIYNVAVKLAFRGGMNND